MQPMLSIFGLPHLW